MKQGLRKGAWLAAVSLAGAIWAPAMAKEQVDLILYDAHVLTVDDEFSVASAVAVKGDRIVAVGDEQIRNRYSAVREIDLDGRTLMPGFTDTHLHPIPVAPSDIDVASARSIGEVQAMLREKAAAVGPGKWITGFGWEEGKLAENRNLTRSDLDAVTPDNPVMLVRAGAHSAVINSVALRMAGVDRNTPDPPGGLIEHDANGELNGIIRERYEMVRALIPNPTWEQMRPSYIAWLRGILALGITSFFNASGSIDDEPADKGGRAEAAADAALVGANMTFRRARQIYDEMGDTLPRMTMYIQYPGAERLKAFPFHTGHGDERLRLGPIGESAVDGGFTGPTAWLLVDYKGQPGFRGKGRFTDQELQDMVDTSARLGWQMGLHAIGDAAIVQTVNAYHTSLNSIPSSEHAQLDRRWFTDHFTIMPPDETMATMRGDNIMIAQQPNFLYNLEDRYTQVLDDWRLAHNNSVATPAHKFGLFVALGSDNLPTGPFVGLYTAVTRKGPSGRVHGIEEAVSRQEAIRMYTANGPYLSWEEDIKGTIEPGKLADMIVLPFDPLTAGEDALFHGKVDMTFVGGKLVYDRAAEAD
jgi:predicted amidohydrolase YtcJ